MNKNGSQWPDATEPEDWELVPDMAAAVTAPLSPVVTFDPAAVAAKEHVTNPKILHHSQSSPDLRHLGFTEDEDDEVESAVLVDDSSSLASSAVLVSGPPSVWSVGSNKLSFRDAILQNQGKSKQPKDDAEVKKPKKSFKTRFVVVQPDKKSSLGVLRNSRSMGNLRALDHIQEDHDDEDLVLGETDADDFYSRKAQGALGRRNGQKTRPDEAKRLEMTMAKKSLQRKRQMNRG